MTVDQLRELLAPLPGYYEVHICADQLDGCTWSPATSITNDHLQDVGNVAAIHFDGEPDDIPQLFGDA